MSCSADAVSHCSIHADLACTEATSAELRRCWVPACSLSSAVAEADACTHTGWARANECIFTSDALRQCLPAHPWRLHAAAQFQWPQAFAERPPSRPAGAASGRKQQLACCRTQLPARSTSSVSSTGSTDSSAGRRRDRLWWWWAFKVGSAEGGQMFTWSASAAAC